MEFGEHTESETSHYNIADKIFVIFSPFETAMRGFFNERSDYHDQAPIPELQTAQDVAKGFISGLNDYLEVFNLRGRTYDVEHDDDGSMTLSITEQGPSMSQTEVKLYISDNIVKGAHVLRLDQNGNTDSFKSGKVSSVFASSSPDHLAQRVGCFIQEHNDATGNNIEVDMVDITRGKFAVADTKLMEIPEVTADNCETIPTTRKPF